jgi:putative NADPH-quinone reductase
MSAPTAKIAVLLGHPDVTSLCGSIARAYADAARSAGAEVREINLAELTFDPVLWHGYNEIQTLEPDLLEAQDTIRWADVLVFAYPTWWGTVPALLKGFVDRVFLPGFAFKYRDNSRFWDRLLAGRSARLLVTMDSPHWYYRFVARQPGHQMMRRAILGFSGVKPVRTTVFGPVRTSTATARDGWLARAAVLGGRDATR